MMIGPEPMRRIFFRSVRRGMVGSVPPCGCRAQDTSAAGERIARRARVREWPARGEPRSCYEDGATDQEGSIAKEEDRMVHGGHGEHGLTRLKTIPFLLR